MAATSRAVCDNRIGMHYDYDENGTAVAIAGEECCGSPEPRQRTPEETARAIISYLNGGEG